MLTSTGVDPMLVMVTLWFLTPRLGPDAVKVRDAGSTVTSLSSELYMLTVPARFLSSFMLYSMDAPGAMVTDDLSKMTNGSADFKIVT